MKFPTLAAPPIQATENAPSGRSDQTPSINFPLCPICFRPTDRLLMSYLTQMRGTDVTRPMEANTPIPGVERGEPYYQDIRSRIPIFLPFNKFL